MNVGPSVGVVPDRRATHPHATSQAKGYTNPNNVDVDRDVGMGVSPLPTLSLTILAYVIAYGCTVLRVLRGYYCRYAKRARRVGS